MVLPQRHVNASPAIQGSWNTPLEEKVEILAHLRSVAEITTSERRLVRIRASIAKLEADIEHSSCSPGTI